METENLHVHQFRKTDVPATCKAGGYTLYTCDCGYEHKTNFTPAGAHSFQFVQASPASCCEPGSAVMACTECGETQVRSFPPLGHDFGNWVIQSYPTCQTPGSQIRKCRRCSATEAGQVAPVGHRCAPNTGRYEKGKLVEYFCQNCGQTVHCAPQIVSAQNAGHFWPTKILLIITAALAFVYMALTLYYTKMGLTQLLVPWWPYLTNINTIAWCAVFFWKMDSIKKSEKIPGWLGLAPLSAGLISAAGTVAAIFAYQQFLGPEEMNSIVASEAIYFAIQTVPVAAFAVLLTCGIRKRLWLPIVVLCVAGLLFIGYMVAYCNIYIFSSMYMICQLSGYFAIILYMVSWAMMLLPPKKEMVSFVQN